MTSTSSSCSKIILVCLTTLFSQFSYSQSLKLEPLSPILGVDHIDEVYYSLDNVIYVVTDDFSEIHYSSNKIDWQKLTIPEGKVTGMSFFSDGSVVMEIDDNLLYVSRNHSSWNKVYENREFNTTLRYKINNDVLYVASIRNEILESTNYGEDFSTMSIQDIAIRGLNVSDNYIYLTFFDSSRKKILVINKAYEIIDTIQNSNFGNLTNFYVSQDDKILFKFVYGNNYDTFSAYATMNGIGSDISFGLGSQNLSVRNDIDDYVFFRNESCYITDIKSDTETDPKIYEYSYKDSVLSIIYENFEYQNIVDNGVSTIAYDSKNLFQFDLAEPSPIGSFIFPKTDSIEQYDKLLAYQNGMLAITSNNKLYLSDNSGKSWNLFPIEYGDINDIHYSHTGILYILSDSYIIHSDDNGKTVAAYDLTDGGDGELIIISDDFLCIDHPNYQLISRDRGLSWNYNISIHRIKKGTYYNHNGTSYYNDEIFNTVNYQYEKYINPDVNDVLYIDSSMVHMHNSSTDGPSFYTLNLGQTIIQSGNSPIGKLEYGPNRESTYLIDQENQLVHYRNQLNGNYNEIDLIGPKTQFKSVTGDRSGNLYFLIESDSTIIPYSSRIICDDITATIEVYIDYEICSGDTFRGYTVTGSYIDTIRSTSSCDSIVHIDLSVLNQSTISENIIICEGQSYQGYTQSGSYQYNNLEANGCSPIINLDLQVIPLSFTDTIRSNYYTCQEDINIDYQNGDTIYDTIVSNNSCVINELTVIESSPTLETLAIEICEGESYNGYTISGNYVDTLVNIGAGDSIIGLELIVHPTVYQEESIDICVGSNYRGYNQPGLYTIMLPSSDGCDTILTFDLSISESITTYNDVYLCKEEESNLYFSSGTYTSRLVASGGCDSIVINNVIVESCINPCYDSFFIKNIDPTITSGFYGKLLNDNIAIFKHSFGSGISLGSESDHLFIRQNGTWNDEGSINWNTSINEDILISVRNNKVDLQLIDTNGTRTSWLTVEAPNIIKKATANREILAITTDEGLYMLNINSHHQNFIQINNFSDISSLKLDGNSVLISRNNGILNSLIVYDYSNTGWIKTSINSNYEIENYLGDVHFKGDSINIISNKYLHTFKLENGTWIEKVIDLNINAATIVVLQIRNNKIFCVIDRKQYLLVFTQDEISLTRVYGVQSITENKSLRIKWIFDYDTYGSNIFGQLSDIDNYYIDNNEDRLGDRLFGNRDTLRIQICPDENYNGYTTTGDYFISSNNRCQDSTILQLTILDEDDPACAPSSTEEIEEKLISISPNPSSSIITIRLKETIDDQDIKIYDTKGQIVARYDMNTEIHNIDISNLVNGVYLLEVHSYQGRHVESFVKI